MNVVARRGTSGYDRVHDLAAKSEGFYKAAFFLLLSFVLGNGVSFVVFGVHTASKSDVAEVSRVQTDEFNSTTSKIDGLELALTKLTAQLVLQKLITP